MRGILRELWRYRLLLLLGVLALFAVDAAQLVTPLIVRAAVDDLVAGLGTRLPRYALYLVGIAGVVLVFRFLWRYFLFGAGRKIERDLRNRLFSHLLTLSPSFYSRHSTGDLMAHATNDLEAVRRACGMGVLLAADTLIMVSFSLAAMVSISPRLTLLTFIPLPFITLVVLGFGRLIHRRFERVQASFARLTERVREALSGIRVLRAFAREEGMERVFAADNQEYIRLNMALVRVWGVFRPLIGLLAGLGTGIVLWFGGRAVLAAEISLGDFVAFTSYLGMLVWPMMALGWIVNLLQRGAASMGRIQVLFDAQPEIQSPPSPKPFPRTHSIEFRNLSFSYPGEERQVLREITVTVEEGMTLGVVGLTGAGKTTLVRLIPRLYDPPPGTLLLGGTDVRELELERLRGAIGMVPQDVFLFSATLRENISFGRPEATDDEVWQAARLAGLAGPFLERSGLEVPDAPYLRRLLDIARHRAEKCADFPGLLRPYLAEPVLGEDAMGILREQGALEVLEVLAKRLQAAAGTGEDVLRTAFEETSERTGRKGRGLYMPVRVALTGSVKGVEIMEIVPVLGMERVIRRLRAAIAAVAIG